MSEQTEVSKIEYPQQGITITYGSQPSPIDRMTSDAFEMLGIAICFLPILYIIGVWLRHKADEATADAIIRQGMAEADRQSELRRKRQAELKKST